MRARELKRWLAEAERLTPAQQEKVLAKLQGQRSEGLVTRLVSERVPAACPHCAGGHLVRHGQSGGAQRFRCRAAASEPQAGKSSPYRRSRLVPIARNGASSRLMGIRWVASSPSG